MFRDVKVPKENLVGDLHGGALCFHQMMIPDIDVSRIIAAFAALTDSQREVLALRFVADLGLERVAALTGRPVGAGNAVDLVAKN